jgi:SecD/SecF fusion protein
MQATTSNRFLVTAAVVLSTTLIPWLYYGKYLHGVAVEEEALARLDLETARGTGKTGTALEEKEKKFAEAVKKVKSSHYELKFGLDLKGGASITYRVAAEDGQDQASVLKDAIEITRFRVDAMGVGEVNIVESGVNQFTVELPGRGKEEIDRIKDIMGKTGALEFRIVAEQEITSSESMRREREKEKYVPTPGYAWYASEEGREYLLEVPDQKAKAELAAKTAERDAALKAGKPAAEVAPLEAAVAAADKAAVEAGEKYLWTGDDLESADVVPAPEGPRGAYEISFSINAGRKTAFGDFTGSNINRQMAIVLNSMVHTAPEIGSKLPGSGRIYSKHRPYTQESARDLVTVLQSGSYKVRPEEVSSFVVGPGVGELAVLRGKWAVGISTLLVLATMVLFYRGAGWVANLAVVLNLVMTLGILMFLGAALSLPGIAALILTLGMAVDANILVNERIREEKEAGKGLAQALAAGYDRAWVTILDSNLTTILAGIVLYWIGTGPVRGFALTLVVGLLISMFTACYVTRTIFLWGLELGILTEFRMMRIVPVPPFRYTAARRFTIGISAILIVLGTAAFVARDRYDKYDLEFTGGQRVVLALKKSMSIAELKARMEKQGLGEIGVRTIRSRGTDTGNLDVASESDTFEITARIRAKAEGRVFDAKVREAFRDELLPAAIERVELGKKDEGGRVPVRAVLNFATKDLDPAKVKGVVLAAPLFKGATDLKVEAVPGDGRAFAVSGNVALPSTGDPELFVKQDLARAVDADPAVSLSEPIPQSDFIGPGVANRLREQAIIAVLLSTLAQIVYLRFRFRDFTYGFAAAIIVAHNVLITLGAVAVGDALGIAHVKINLPVIASFLTLIGYSVNDTIVVFDRIRENLGRSIHPTSELIDRAISDTLARSIRTSITVLLVALTMFGANWNTNSGIEGFCFVMVIGVITSAYASVFISSPLLLFLPVYSGSLLKLGRPVVLALIAALFLGLGIASTQDGLMAWFGGAIATLLPLHFLVHLAQWLRQPDPDQLLRDIGGRVPAAA